MRFDEHTRSPRWIAALAALTTAFAPACSVVYDADVFSEVPDATPPPDSELPPPDVNVTALMIDDRVPSSVYEGAGCVDDEGACAPESRPVPIVVTGSNIAATAMVTLDGAGFENETVASTTSSDGTMIAFELSVPVMPALGAGASDTITITVTQGGVEDSIDLEVVGLDELVASTDIANGMLDTADIAAVYSTIDLDIPVTLTGSAAAQLIATSRLTVNAALSADGGAAVGTAQGAGAAGGCNGGSATNPGQCLDGGGRAGGDSAGGGGGGHLTVGDQGGSGGGNGGIMTGSDELVPLVGERGNGGGGGGQGSLGAAGGGGGGGGGIIELTSYGALEIGADADLSADGGSGDAGGGSCAIILEKGGGGGGGSGGAVFVRSARSLTDTGTGTRASVAGGAKGDGGCNAGGDGADGRVRVDVPTDAATPAFAGPDAYRGPVVTAAPTIATTSPVTIDIVGAAGTTYYVEREGAAREAVTTGANRRAAHDVTLAEGINLVCAVVRMDVNITSPEGTNCVSIAYLP